MANDEHYAIAPAWLVRSMFGVTIENWVPHRLDPTRVPAVIRDLVPLAQLLGVTCDVTRHDLEAILSETQLIKLSESLRGRHDDIIDFLYESEHPDGHILDEAAAFQALLVLEMEAVNGPGIPGYLTWALRKYTREPTPSRLARLRHAYAYVCKNRVRFVFREEVRETERILRDTDQRDPDP